jgi:DNA-directed RNA polymerase subunit E'/Rpb7
MVKIESPYINTEEYTRIKLQANQLNSDIYTNLKYNLISRVKDKCNKNGFVDEIYKILETGDGYIYAEDLTASPIYQIKYSCRLCVPQEGTYIITKVNILHSSLISTEHGPIVAFIDKFSNNFTTNGNNITYNKTKSNINIGDYVVIYIRRRQINAGDTNIKLISTLEDMATDEQVKNYYTQEINNNSM